MVSVFESRKFEIYPTGETLGHCSCKGPSYICFSQSRILKLVQRMQTLFVTLIYVSVGFALSFEIAKRRTKGLISGLLAYCAGFVGVLLATSFTGLFDAPGEPRNELVVFAPLVAFIAPAVGVFFGRARSP